MRARHPALDLTERSPRSPAPWTGLCAIGLGLLVGLFLPAQAQAFDGDSLGVSLLGRLYTGLPHDVVLDDFFKI